MAINWGLIGLGILGQDLAAAFAGCTTGRLVACAGRTHERALEYARSHGVERAHPSYEELLADPAVDAVFVATPNHLHHSMVLAAARAGKHVLCEKPMAPTAREAEEMIAACRAAGVRLQIGFQQRLLPALQTAAEVVREGRLGAVREVVAQRCSGIPGGSLPAWRKDLALCQAGVLADVGVHMIDWLLFLLGEPIVRVFALAYPPRSSGRPEEMVTLLLEFTGGCQATVRASRGLPRGNNDLHLFGTAGTLSTGPLRFADTHTLSLRTPEGEKLWEFPVGDLFVPELDAFAAELAGNPTPAATGEDGLRTVRVVEAAVRSMETGEAVAVD